MKFQSSFIALVTVYSKFRPDETQLFFVLINFMQCHQICLCGMLFDKIETLVKNDLIFQRFQEYIF
jgi:hypothetical protein